jgi:CO dehydrogenase/acetyl-CoA synthase alpha subunit
LNSIHRNDKMNHYVNVDQKNYGKNRSNRDEYNRKSVKTLIRKNEDLGKEIDLSNVHLEYHQKKKKSYY